MTSPTTLPSTACAPVPASNPLRCFRASRIRLSFHLREEGRLRCCLICRVLTQFAFERLWLLFVLCVCTCTVDLTSMVGFFTARKCDYYFFDRFPTNKFAGIGVFFAFDRGAARRSAY